MADPHQCRSAPGDAVNPRIAPTMATDLTEFDTAKYLTEPEDQDELLADALATGDPGVLAQAVGIVARAKGVLLTPPSQE